MDAESVGGLLRARAREHPGRLFWRCGDDRATFAEADARSDRVAAGLAAADMRRGDRVALVAPNRAEVLELFFACAKLGAILVPMNVFLRGEFLRYQLDDCQASTLVADAAGCASVADMDLPELRRVVSLDEPEVVGYERPDESDAAPQPELGPADLLSIMYTSGTTGMPKGCMLSHGWYLQGARVGKAVYDYNEGDVLFTPLPLFHAWAQGMVMGALVHGLTVVVEPAFSASGLMARIAETGATHFAGVGMMGAAMLAVPASPADRGHRLRSALLLPFTPEQQEQFHARFGARVHAQLYGQTECGAITYSPASGRLNPMSIGEPSPHFEVRLVDDEDADVPPGEVGEIVVRPRVPHAMFQGYWRKPEETIGTWRNLWHHTGDYGRTLDDGSMAFVDRKKDALRRRGENVSSIQVEGAIAVHPKVQEVAVHAVPSELSEDDIKACVVVAAGETVSPEELFAFFREHLPYFAIPRYIEVVPELPRNATLRVMKHVLRERGVTETTWDLEALGLTVGRAERR